MGNPGEGEGGMERMLEAVRIGRELRRVAQCGDIPAYRRRQLMALADELDPLPKPRISGSVDMFADGYYRRGGLRMRLPATLDDDSQAVSHIALLGHSQ